MVVPSNVPVFYFPWLGTTIEDPLGPLESVNFGVAAFPGSISSRPGTSST